jgi:hypothetical protein
VLAFNPGVPATGAASPLWAVVVGALHLGTSDVAALLVTLKLVGFALHMVAVWLLLRALAERDRVAPACVAGCGLAAFHPDLVAASMSGTEVPLAAVVGSALVLAAQRGSVAGYGGLSLAAPLVRPELAVLSLLLPVLLLGRDDRRRLARVSGTAAVSTLAAFALVGGYNLAVSGLPFASSFYAKVGGNGPSLVGAPVTGFTDLIGSFPIADSSILLGVAAVVAGRALLAAAPASAGSRVAAAALVGALAFCAVSFVVIPPTDPKVFASQRYVLPVLSLIVAALVVLLLSALQEVLPARSARLAHVGVLVLLVLSVLVTARVRYGILDNDARNVDDLQVSIGKHLAAATPGQVAWMVDSGAARYFGGAFVVDLSGRNSAPLLGPGAQRYLDAHPPRYIELVPTRSAMDAAAGRGLTATHVQPSTPYTVASSPATQHRFLVDCDDPAPSRRLAVWDRSFPFRCAPVDRATAAIR